ncbi:hypothetical protein [Bradyrhizobium sp. AUGA SZCCT0182]|uniref:hypothetical protein n=1 Tax=Bradyrhizobium sp. AUGA SZCCT0182 TaxID=2807667 RepID=UPI001BA48C2F|nr:hypothetical protein [Bradyrhizobium sp. AUGA SZCCT0182]MBR1232810.1 hypothetical protein [Bradyrhizobium sp. AUGA SZCCT0182]
MASERQRAANRANAKKSTGPKSAAGKYRASRNAFRHGLSAPPVADDARTARVEGLARKVADSMGGAMDIEQARLFAIAQLEVERVRSAAVAISAQVFADMEGGKLPERTTAATINSTEPEEGAFKASAHLRTLKGVDRYMRRAASRRDNVVKALALSGL